MLDVADLSTVLDSVTPLISFSKYLEQKKPEHLHLLRFIKMVKILEEQISDSNELHSSLERVRKES